MAKKYRYAKATVKSNRTFTGHLLGFAFVLLIIYALVSLVSQQSQIAEQKEKIAEVKTQIAELQQENDEYTRLLSNEDESEYIRRIAIERLGYAYPNERRFYVIESGTIAGTDSTATEDADSDTDENTSDSTSDTHSSNE